MHMHTCAHMEDKLNYVHPKYKIIMHINTNSTCTMQYVQCNMYSAICTVQYVQGCPLGYSRRHSGSSGCLQLCAGQEAACEAGVHAMRILLEDADVEAVLLSSG